MKTFIVALVALSLVIMITGALPVDQDEIELELEGVDAGLKISPEKILNRQRRFTCDVFSFSSQVVTPNHAACAAKCIGMGKKGGHCEGTNCICRSDSWLPGK